MAIVSTMGVSQTMVSQMMAVSQTVSVSETVSVSVVSISFRLSLSLPLVQSSDVLGRVSTRVELADSVSVSEVPQTVDVVKTKTNSVSVSVSVERISLGFSTSLVDEVDSSQRTAAIAGGIQTQCPCSGPCWGYTSGAYQGIGVHCGYYRDYKVASISISLSRGQGGYSQAGGNQELVHD